MKTNVQSKADQPRVQTSSLAKSSGSPSLQYKAGNIKSYNTKATQRSNDRMTRG